MKIYLIKSDNSEAGTHITLPQFENLEIIEDKNLKSIPEQSKIALISESSISKVVETLKEQDPRKKAIELLKDKYLFRNHIKMKKNSSWNINLYY